MRYHDLFGSSLPLALLSLLVIEPLPARAAPPRLVDDLIKTQVLDSLSQAVRTPVSTDNRRPSPAQWSRRAIIESLDQRAQPHQAARETRLPVELSTTSPPLLQPVPTPRASFRPTTVRLAQPAKPGSAAPPEPLIPGRVTPIGVVAPAEAVPLVQPATALIEIAPAAVQSTALNPLRNVPGGSLGNANPLR